MKTVIKQLEPPDSFHLSAAQGWLELGNHLEANEELEKIAPLFRAHPDVLEIRWQIYANEKKWIACIEIGQTLTKIAPSRAPNWIHYSFALHELKQTEEAKENLLPIVKRFPKDWRIPYNLSCYCSQLNQFEEAQKWFKQAMAIDEKAVINDALDDLDLKPLWVSMGGTIWKLE